MINMTKRRLIKWIGMGSVGVFGDISLASANNNPEGGNLMMKNWTNEDQSVTLQVFRAKRAKPSYKGINIKKVEGKPSISKVKNVPAKGKNRREVIKLDLAEGIYIIEIEVNGTHQVKDYIQVPTNGLPDYKSLHVRISEDETKYLVREI